MGQTGSKKSNAFDDIYTLQLLCRPRVSVVSCRAAETLSQVIEFCRAVFGFAFVVFLLAADT